MYAATLAICVCVCVQVQVPENRLCLFVQVLSQLPYAFSRTIYNYGSHGICTPCIRSFLHRTYVHTPYDSHAHTVLAYATYKGKDVGQCRLYHSLKAVCEHTKVSLLSCYTA